MRAEGVIPDAMPDDPLEDLDAQDLMNTLQGICNESTLTRAEILGALEAVKLSLFAGWRDDQEGT
jgi:hypothetical protein